LLRRVFARDALRCPRCSSRMRILARIHPPDTTRAILDGLGLASRSRPRRAGPAPLSRPRHGGLNSGTNAPAHAGPDHPKGRTPPPRRPSARPFRPDRRDAQRPTTTRPAAGGSRILQACGCALRFRIRGLNRLSAQGNAEPRLHRSEGRLIRMARGRWRRLPVYKHARPCRTQG
jgi:hypothetical protein